MNFFHIDPRPTQICPGGRERVQCIYIYIDREIERLRLRLREREKERKHEARRKKIKSVSMVQPCRQESHSSQQSGAFRLRLCELACSSFTW